MKGTFISADFAQDSTGSLKFLEINTDTTLPNANSLDWTGITQLISGSSLTGENITEFHVVYKREVHDNIINSLSSSLAASSSVLNVTSFTEHPEELETIYPTSVEDANYKFILRLAYDENAILDSNYCKDSVEGLMLFKDNNDLDSCIPFFYSGSHGFNNNLNHTINPTQFPDLARKSVNAGSNIRFGKIANYLSGSTFVSSSEYDSIRFNQTLQEFSSSADMGSNSYLMNYIYSTASVSDGCVSSLRSYHVVYGSSLSTIDLGVHRIYAPLTIPSASVIEVNLNTTSSLYIEYGINHTYEYSTSTLKENYFEASAEGLFEIDNYVSSSGELIHGSEIKTKLDNEETVILKSIYVPGLPDTDRTSVYLGWELSGDTFPSGTIESSSVVQIISEKPMSNQSLYRITADGQTSASYFGAETNLLVYNSGSDLINFTPITKIDTVNENYYFLDSGSNKTRITNNEFIIFNENTGSFWSVDTETLDIVYTTLGNNLNALTPIIAFHQACFVAGTEITLSNGDTKNIEDIIIGDVVKTFNEETQEIEEGKVYNILTPGHSDLVKYRLSDGTEITSTQDHPYYVNGLSLASYNPASTNVKYDMPRKVSKINIGDTLTKLDGSSVTLDSIELLQTDIVTTYLISVEGNENFYANGILVHNKPPDGQP